MRPGCWKCAQGSLSVINVADMTVRHYDFDDLGDTDASLIAKGAILLLL